MKRLFSMLLVLCMVLTLLPGNVFAAEIVASGECGAQGDNVTWTLDSNGLLTISGTGEMKDFYTSFLNQYDDDVINVVVCDGVTSIGKAAFSGCRALESISIPNTITKIEDFAFDMCNLRKVFIPASVSYLSTDAFMSTYDLEEIVVDSDNQSYSSSEGVLLDKGATKLLLCPKGKSGAYVIPDTVITIGERAFAGCTGLTSIICSAALKQIEASAFRSSCITYIVIPETILNIGHSAFEDCYFLEEIYYAGSENCWQQIQLEDNNNALSSATIHFNSTGPDTSDEEVIKGLRYGLEHTYSFENLTDRISDDIFKKVFHYQAIGSLVRRFFNDDGTTGQCHGMSLTAAASMVYAAPSESSYRHQGKTAYTLSDVDVDWISTETGISASEYIKYAHVFQYMPCRKIEKLSNTNDLEGFITAVRNYSDENGEPVLLSIIIIQHEVLVLGIEFENDSEISFAVYDSNSPQHYGHVLFHKDGELDYSDFDYRYYSESDGDWVVIKGCGSFRYDAHAVSTFIDYWNGALSQDTAFAGYTNLLATDVRNLMIQVGGNPTMLENASYEQFLPIEVMHGSKEAENGAASLYWTKDTEMEIEIPESEPSASVSFASFDAGVTVTAPGGTAVSLTASEGASAAAELTLPESDDFSVEYLTAAADAEDAVTIRIEGRGQIVQSSLTADGIQVHADEVKDVTVTFAVDDVVLDTVAVGTLHGDMTVTEDKDHLQISGDVEPPAQQDNPFTDVPSDQYYFEPVLWAVNHDPQITNGTSKTTFSPDATCTRGQVVTFLWRSKGCPEPKSTKNPFSDVPTGAYYYKAVLWANETGVTNGTSKTTFSPENPCTRAHVVTFLWRAESKPAAGKQNPFTDVPAGQYYTDAVLWAVSKNITNGTSPTTFSPDNPCTRGQIVTFLYRDMK